MDTLDEIIERTKASRPPAQVIELFPAPAEAPARTNTRCTPEEGRALYHSNAVLSMLLDLTVGGSDELLARVEGMLRLASFRIHSIKRMRSEATGQGR